MFNSPILDLVILLSFTYFIGSLILTSSNEFIAAIFRLRQNQLKDALENLFPGTWKNFVQQTLLKSPHIQALMKTPDRYPVYIPAKNFVSALVQQIGSGSFDPKALPAAVQASPLPPEMKQVMLDLFAKTEGNLAKFQIELETFYNDAMDRAGGWYKRKMRTVMLVLGGIVAIALNLDTIKIAKDSLQDTGKLSKTIDNISAQMSNVNFKNGSFVIKDSANREVLTIKVDSTSSDSSKNGIDTTQRKGATAVSSTTVQGMKQDVQNIKSLQLIYQNNTGYNLGYKDFASEWWPAEKPLLSFIKKLLGILLTVFALQLGANYWFDTLNRVINVRAAGKKPGELKK